MRVWSALVFFFPIFVLGDEPITCGSVIKLMNVQSKIRLHSHDIKYGSGSRQQSVTGMPNPDDVNSHWQILGANKESCARGTPVKCGDTIRFLHLKTKCLLHSHDFPAPLTSNNQEVSCFGSDGEGDRGDNWKVICSNEIWTEDEDIKLKHIDTGKYLSTSGQQYGRPITNQFEVVALTSPSNNAMWRSAEGVIMQVSKAVENSILDDYENCKKDRNFGINGTVLCDLDDSLKAGTKNQLEQLLDQLKNKVNCNCDNGCFRGEGITSDFVGLLLVSNSEKIEKAGKPLASSAQDIFEDSLLGNETCDNGLLIVYIQDKKKLATYRGGGNFLLFTDNDMERLHQIAVKGNRNIQDQAALRYLLTNYDSLVERSEVKNADSWTPLWGLLLALVLLLILLAILAACLFAKVCCCCRKRTHKKDKYYVTPVSTYKPTPEPIYIVTPPPPHLESIYNSPFAGSPLPPPHPATFTPRSPSSRPITPSSTHRTRILQSPSSPRSSEKPSVSRTVSASSKQQNKIVPLETATPEIPPHKDVKGQASPNLDVTSNSSIDLPFLDPRRLREIQTKEDYIY
ncbi:hypothetical protein FO519_003418 [Halicephalobus sp. NKZ332]|nr:hypothetical protein FO519_003418 [Halicephalobus sp. NKZ332]